MSLDEYAVAVLGPDTDVTGFATRSFIGLGGDSLRAMRLAALVRERHGVRIPVADLLSATPLADVLAGAPGLSPAPVDDQPAGESVGALSPTQRGMWMTEKVVGGSTYNLVFTCHLDSGRLDRDAFERAVAATTDRHASLRTVFREQDGDVVPVVLARHTPDITDVTHMGDAAEFEDAVRGIAADHGRRPFDLTAAPAFRLIRVTNPAGRQAIVLTGHHMVLDGWAIGLLFTEIFGNYDAFVAGEPSPYTSPAPTTRALVSRHEAVRESGEWDRQAEFWLQHLDGVPTVLELPADRPRPAIQDPRGERTTVDLGPDLSDRVKDRAQELGVTRFAFLLGAYALTLSRWTGARRMLIGVSLYGRDTDELADLIAVAGNLVGVRVDVDDDQPVAEFLGAVQHSLAQSIDAGTLPFDELVNRLGVERSLGAHPLVQVCFGMHDQLVPQHITTSTGRLTVEEGHGGGAQFDLSLLFGRSEPTLAAQLEYATSVWSKADAEGFAADFATAATELAGGNTALEQLRCVSSARRAVLDELNDTRQDFPAVTLDELFRDVVRRTPDAIAVREGDIELTYAQLAGAAAEQARLLRDIGVQPGDRVVVALDRSIAETVAVLGITWAGAAYVGVDLTVPGAHTEKILAKADARAALVSAVPDILAQQGIPVCGTWQPGWPSADVPAEPADPARIAYVAFTSGSTGVPKGVAVPHRAGVRLVHEAGFVALGSGDRVLRLSPLAFDASTLEFWGPLVSGATMEVYPAGIPAPSELGEFLLHRGVTVAWLTAGLFRLVEEFTPDSLGGLRQLITGGDVVPHDHVARVLDRHPGIVITNGYGPTENTTFTATYSMTAAAGVDGPLPIGTPIAGTKVYVLDERHRLLPPGAVGELYAAGSGLADGYIGDEKETARCFGHFCPDVPERLYRTGDLVRIDSRGRLRFLGRRDSQVKLRGYRVELSAINDALSADPRVADSVVLVSDGDSADKRLIAAVVPATTVRTDELRDVLAGQLPVYMVPTLWAVVDRIPVTSNGKIDRRALAAVAAPAGQQPHLPEQPDEDYTSMSAFFTKALPDAPAGEFSGETDFFTVGGNSMGALRLIRLVKDELGVTVRLRDFLLSPTPAGLHQLIEKATTA
ncbi:non-ribosomal peptide synthetase [Kibdelosporangium phytohabitans]|uniref:Non-ribosomal peptide synthetase n=1 Tax=Kibdelosporangium phytohabitans TaxID=860235 RepID=A0A0N9I032_9PSEU|nr:non-ribosomal peptide synthetase [Kibdelosporangium phytohabitans]ALG10936.1 non-ribosomal peptide synthetase [Kibdelosporangium phytohabitans]MBE1462136.1 amino acid adenylation domain-containing protein [Kibdelosporangium phytohabitans]